MLSYAQTTLCLYCLDHSTLHKLVVFGRLRCTSLYHHDFYMVISWAILKLVLRSVLNLATSGSGIFKDVESLYVTSVKSIEYWKRWFEDRYTYFPEHTWKGSSTVHSGEIFTLVPSGFLRSVAHCYSLGDTELLTG